MSLPAPSPFRPFFLTGPTGSGKSALALALAPHFPFEIVNADAFQLYRGIPAITACPSPAERQLCPHHLFEVLDPSETCGAGRYLSLVQPVLAEIAGRQRIPLVTGGSGLYLKAITHGLGDTLPSNPEIRATLDSLNLAEIREKLALTDPESLRRIGLDNRRYLQRALEISLSAGRPASQVRRSWSADPPGLRGIFLDWPRTSLYERINARVHTMLDQGAIAEVEAVSAWSPTSARAIGVPEILAHLRGELDLPSCIRLIQQASRRYAKRQLTWFRREPWLTPIPPPDLPLPGSVPSLLPGLLNG